MSQTIFLGKARSVINPYCNLFLLTVPKSLKGNVYFWFWESLKLWFCVAGGLFHHCLPGWGHPQQSHESCTGVSGKASFSAVWSILECCGQHSQKKCSHYLLLCPCEGTGRQKLPQLPQTLPSQYLPEDLDSPPGDLTHVYLQVSRGCLWLTEPRHASAPWLWEGLGNGALKKVFYTFHFL